MEEELRQEGNKLQDLLEKGRKRWRGYVQGRFVTALAIILALLQLTDLDKRIGRPTVIVSVLLALALSFWVSRLIADRSFKRRCAESLDVLARVQQRTASG